MATIEKGLEMLRNLPRVALHNIKDFREFQRIRERSHLLPRGKDAKFKLGADHKSAAQRMSRPRLGFGYSTPGYIRQPKEYYYQGHHLMRQYLPVSLFQLQRLIDLGRLNANEPIDMTSIFNTKIVMYDQSQKIFGIRLTEEGADVFKAKVNLEVQWTLSEMAIAAVEKNGGSLTTKYYDRDCVRAMVDPRKFFALGAPIPRNGTPPLNAIEYYTSAANRGYLANPEQVRVERLKLAQKFGYELPDLEQDPQREMLARRKDPRQIWYDLEPGWLVNLVDKVVIKPTDPEWVEYYKS